MIDKNFTVANIRNNKENIAREKALAMEIIILILDTTGVGIRNLNQIIKGDVAIVN
jgi:hypothetical protein